jgi:hypothetical protein
MAFAKALKDDFVHARVAGLMAFMACIECFETEELAGKVLGVVGGALVDKEKSAVYSCLTKPGLTLKLDLSATRRSKRSPCLSKG